MGLSSIIYLEEDMGKKTAKKVKGSKKDTTTKGVGRKLAIYVPKVDEWVIDELDEIQKARLAEGYRTSLSYELIRLVKEALESKK